MGTGEERARVGVDVGGTFTDVVIVRDGALSVTKVPSTPGAPDEGVLEGLETGIGETAADLGEVGFLAHGTTVATNAVLERTWADTALVTTDGFRDALEIGRQARPDIYDFHAEKPKPIVERDLRFEVEERLDERGEVEVRLDESSVAGVAADVDDAGVESVAVCTLFSFENGDHERRIREGLEREGVDAAVSLSSEVLPEIREYERSVATSLNAALKPVMDAYIGRLGGALDERGVTAPLRIMQSNGGIIDASQARETPINTLLSGPAAGVQGAAHVAGLCGHDDVITMDMGGTSCDVSLVRGGDPIVSTEVEVEEYPVSVPMIEIHTIGAGGGSIGWIDAGGALRVGPRSAGADPGPICYGHGGTEPTVTDAHLLLGRIDPERFVEDLEADVDRVRHHVREKLADPLDASVEEAAQGMLDVANANMERALRVVSVERGHDPREFGLVAFGGAGPLHAAALADDLGVPRVVVPRTAGVLSALGLLITDLVHDVSTSRVRPWGEVSPADLDETYEDFEREGRQRLPEGHEVAFERWVDLRYEGQSFELRVDVPNGSLDDAALEGVAERFHERHERRYGHASPDEPIELVTIRLRARGLVEPPDLRAAEEGGDPDDAIREERTVVFDGDPRETRVYDRERLPPGGEFAGPAVVEGGESTVVVRPEQRASVDEYGTIIAEVKR